MKSADHHMPSSPEEQEDYQKHLAELEGRVNNLEQIRELLSVSHAQLQAVLGAATRLSIIATDAQGTILLFNPGAEGMLGYSADQVVGKKNLLMFHLESEIQKRAQELGEELGQELGPGLGGFQVLVAKVRRQGFEEREWTYLRRDGSRLPVNLIVTTVRDEQERITGYLAIATDISQRKRDEESLRRARDELERKVQERTENLYRLNRELEEEIRRRQQVQYNLQRSEAEHRELIDNLNIGVYRNTAQQGGRFIRANPALAAMFGYDSLEEFMLVSVADLYQDPRDRERFIQDLMKKGRVRNRELRLRKKDGTPFWASCTATVKYDEQGEVVAIDGVIEDISQRKQAEKALRESEERFRSLSRNAPDIIYTLGRDGAFTYVNPAWQRILGHEAQEVLGRYFVDFARPDDYRFYVDAFKHVRDRKETIRFTKSLLGKDGREVILDMSAAPNLDSRGRVIGLVGMLKDVTEAKRIERALSESEARYRAAMEGSPDPVVIYDMQGRVEYVNPAFTRVFGWTLEELAGKRLDFVPPEEWERTKEVIKLVAAGETCLDFETRRYTKDGRILDISISSACYRTDGVTPTKSVVTLRDITQRKQAQAALLKSQASLARAQRMAHLGNWELDLATDRLECSEEVFHIYGVPGRGNPVSLQEFFQSVHRDDRFLVKQRMHLAMDEGQSLDFEHRIVRPGGEVRVVHQLAEVVRDEQGVPLQIVGAMQDITERRRSEEEMRLLVRVFENTIEGIVVTDANEVIQMVNRAFTDVTGYSAEEAVGQTPRLLNSGRHSRDFYADMWASLMNSGYWQGEIWNRRKSGEAYPEWLTITAIRDARGQVSHYVGVFHDITETKRNQEQIAYQAYHDALTGLPNRLLFNDRLKMALARAQRKHTGLAVMFLDLDRFKNINDSLGHAVGDRLLQSVAKRLVHWLREEDTVARLGGDEFIMLLQDTMDPEYAMHVGQRILESLSEPFRVGGQDLYVSASIGITLYPHDGRDLETLVSNADIAMYRAKEEGRNNCKLFTPAMNQQVVQRMALETSLRRALDEGEFLLHYQPKVDLRSGQVVGVEALVRWLKPGEGLIPPDEFIPVAEETGLIVPLGHWVLRTACAEIKKWHQMGYRDLHMAVNISPRQFMQKDLVQMVREILRETRLDPCHLELEITENVVMFNVEEAIVTLKELKDLGVRLSMDDFGRGYSSLYYLKRFPMDALKIDRSFVGDIVTDPDDASIVNTIISMSRSLGLEVVAEGVETTDQLDFLRSNACNQMQGFLFSRPVSGEQLVDILKKRKRLK